MSVALRPIRPSDWKSVEGWLHDPDTSRWMLMGRTAPSAEKWCRDLADAWPRAVAMAICRETDGVVVGMVGLFDIDWLSRRAEFRIVVGKDRHKGYGATATSLMLKHGFEGLNLHRIWLGTAAGNEQAQRCFEKAGFKYEGALMDDFWLPEGGYMANYRYAILKPEWEKLNAQA